MLTWQHNCLSMKVDCCLVFSLASFLGKEIHFFVCTLLGCSCSQASRPTFLFLLLCVSNIIFTWTPCTVRLCNFALPGVVGGEGCFIFLEWRNEIEGKMMKTLPHTLPDWSMTHPGYPGYVLCLWLCNPAPGYRDIMPHSQLSGYC